jgi:hypothetical protein
MLRVSFFTEMLNVVTFECLFDEPSYTEYRILNIVASLYSYQFQGINS